MELFDRYVLYVSLYYYVFFQREIVIGVEEIIEHIYIHVLS